MECFAKLGKFRQIRNLFDKLKKIAKLGKFIRKIRKSLKYQEKIRKIGTFCQENNQILGKSPPILGKLEVRPKEKKTSPHLILFGKLGKLSQIRKIHSENSSGNLGKFLLNIRKTLPQKTGSRRQKHVFQLCTHS